MSLLWNGSYCCRQQGLKSVNKVLNHLEAAWRVTSWEWRSTSSYEQIHSAGFQCLQLIHILALSPQVTVDSAWVFVEHIKLWNQNSLSYGVWSQGGADYTVSPFHPEHNYWSCGIGDFCSCCSQYLIADLSGLGPHKLIALSVNNSLNTPCWRQCNAES